MFGFIITQKTVFISIRFAFRPASEEIVGRRVSRQGQSKVIIFCNGQRVRLIVLMIAIQFVYMNHVCRQPITAIAFAILIKMMFLIKNTAPHTDTLVLRVVNNSVSDTCMVAWLELKPII